MPYRSTKTPLRIGLIATACWLATLGAAFAQSPPQGAGVQITASSGNVAAASATATLAGRRQGHLYLWLLDHLGRFDWRCGGEPDDCQHHHGNDDVHLSERGRRDLGESISDRSLRRLHSRQRAEHHDPGFHAIARGWQHKHDGQRLGISALRAWLSTRRGVADFSAGVDVDQDFH